MNLTRRYKLYKLGICPDDKHSEILTFLDSKLLNLQTFEMPEYDGWVFFMTKEGENIMQLDAQLNYLFIKYDEFTEVLNEKFMLDDDDIQDFIRDFLKDTHKTSLNLTCFDQLVSKITGVVEKAYREHVKRV